MVVNDNIYYSLSIESFDQPVMSHNPSQCHIYSEQEVMFQIEVASADSRVSY